MFPTLCMRHAFRVFSNTCTGAAASRGVQVQAGNNRLHHKHITLAHLHASPGLATSHRWHPNPELSEAGVQPTGAAKLCPRQTFVKGLLLDVAGTLLSPSEPITEVYRRYDVGHKLKLSDDEMLFRFRAAYNKPWTRSSLRYVGDAKDFWRFMVAETTGCDDDDYFESVYEYYEWPEAWTVAPGARECLQTLRKMGVKTAIVSNFDMRLPLILDRMNLTPLLDAVVVSAEVQAEKPNPVIFQAAVDQLRLRPEECVHVGDDRRNDLWGARDAGCHALLWGLDVRDMKQVVEWVQNGCIHDD
mmetsp:Transcript_36395/g.102805  ORF Transcript_36395/g.102805 Transcript_36395/m.102805 type:complete len:301 (+) Transcript_36395:425-1327(+)